MRQPTRYGFHRQGSTCCECGEDLSNKRGVQVGNKNYCNKCYAKIQGW